MKREQLVKILEKTSRSKKYLLVDGILGVGVLNQKNEVFIALHISFFLNLENDEYVKALETSHLYIDGVSVAVVARRYGLKKIQIFPTTDLAPLLLHRIGQQEKKAKIGLIGGTQDLVEKTKQVIESGYNVEIVFALNGFLQSWSAEQFNEMSQKVDIIFVGMGVPLEAVFVKKYLHMFSATSIVTCGGLFNFLCGYDVRAPKLIRKFRLEWVWRLLNNPKRLFSRYLHGTFELVRIMILK